MPWPVPTSQVVVSEQYDLLVQLCTEYLLQSDMPQGRDVDAMRAQAASMAVPRTHPMCKFALDGATLENMLGVLLSPRLMGELLRLAWSAAACEWLCWKCSGRQDPVPTR